MDPGELANKLDELQRDKCEGRGVDCVRTVIHFLRLGDIQSARATCVNESDKISSYPEIEKLLEAELAPGWFRLKYGKGVPTRDKLRRRT